MKHLTNRSGNNCVGKTKSSVHTANPGTSLSAEKMIQSPFASGMNTMTVINALMT